MLTPLILADIWEATYQGPDWTILADPLVQLRQLLSLRTALPLSPLSQDVYIEGGT